MFYLIPGTIKALQFMKRRLPTKEVVSDLSKIGAAGTVMGISATKARSNEKPVIVHNKEKGSHNKLKAFKGNKEKWLVSVQMVSEGVDIPRLRVLVYLPTKMTELFFRQAIGRVVRNYIPNDNTRAYVIMPAFKTSPANFPVTIRRLPPDLGIYQLRLDLG